METTLSQNTFYTDKNEAFGVCRHFLELSIPRSVKFIGDSIFGNDGGVIIIRD